MIDTIIMFLIIFWIATVAARWLGRPRIPKPQPMREHYAELNTFREVQYKRLTNAWKRFRSGTRKHAQ